MNRNDVRLGWALVGGRLAHISEFEDILRGSRPRAVCELCRREVIMKLGEKRAHHYAHRPGHECLLQNPESARHYNTKQLLAEKLRAANSLSVVTKCAWSTDHARCIRDLTAVAAEAWDEVLVEPFVDPIRPDILLLRSGKEALAIEVRATHAVSDEKATRLTELGISWIEVEAGGQSDAWKPGAPMRALRHECTSAPRFCDGHLAPVSQGPVEPPASPRRQRRRIAVGEGRDTQCGRWRVRVVDCYPVNGPRARKMFSVYVEDLDPGEILLRLMDDDLVEAVVIAEVRAGSRSREALRTVNDLLRAHLKRHFERLASPLGWLAPSQLPENPAGIYSREFMAVKYRREPEGGWVKSDQHAD